MIDALPASRLALDWTFDPPSALVIVTLTVLWLWLVRRHPRWPRVRSAAAVAAIVAAGIATQSGVATYDASSLTAHVIQHILLGMVVPVLAAASAPITLVLQAADPATRHVVRSALHHPMIRLLSRPLLGFAVFGGSIVVLMFSPLLDVAARNDAVHLLVHVHLVFAGALFAWPLVGADPVPSRPGHGTRLLIVLAAVPFHAFVGAALLTAGAPILDSYPSLADQRRAAGLLWGAGELLTVAVAGIVFTDWHRAEQRAGRRADRRLDHELAR